MNGKIHLPLRIIYMGTPSFAVPPLESLCERERVVLVVTQPDRQSGRGRKLVLSPVKEEALRQGIPLMQPERVMGPQAVHALTQVEPDLIVVAAFGQILPPEILGIPRLGCINIHASLLPRYRGASPIAGAILQGEKVTGITTMMMDPGMDTGAILLQKSLEIAEDDTAGTLTERLSAAGAEAILETLGRLREGTLQRTPQDHSQATYAPLLSKKLGEIDWNQDPQQIRNHVRGMDPWPGAYTVLGGEPLKIWQVSPHGQTNGPGEVLAAAERFIVAAKGGSVVIEQLQLPGKKRVSGPDFLRGRHGLRKGMILGK